MLSSFKDIEDILMDFACVRRYSRCKQTHLFINRPKVMINTMYSGSSGYPFLNVFISELRI